MMTDLLLEMGNRYYLKHFRILNLLLSRQACFPKANSPLALLAEETGLGWNMLDVIFALAALGQANNEYNSIDHLTRKVSARKGEFRFSTMSSSSLG